MQRGLAIAICFIHVRLLFKQCFDQPDFKLDDGEMKRRTVNTTAKIYFNLIEVEQNLRSIKLFISDGETQWRTIVLIKNIWICFPLQKSFQNTTISFECRIVQWSPLPIINMIHYKFLIRREELQKDDKHAFIHMMLIYQPKKCLDIFKLSCSFLARSHQIFTFGRFCVQKPFQRKFLQIWKVNERRWKACKSISVQ